MTAAERWTQPPESSSVKSKGTTIPLMSREDVERLTRSIDKRNARRLKAAIEKPKAPKKKPKPPPRPKGQIVEIPAPLDTKPPKDARFLSEFNSRVEKEQVSRRKDAPTPRVMKSDKRVISPGADPNGTRDGKRRPPKTKVVQKRPPSKLPPGKSDTIGKQRRPSQPGRPGKSAGKTAKVAKPLPPGEGRFALQQDTQSGGDPRPMGSQQVGAPPAPQNWQSLLPTMGPKEIARKTGSIDHIENVVEGENTFLNSREYRHAWFFNRVKRSVRQRWTAASVHRQRDPYGRIYGVRDRLTVVSITLSPSGFLNDIQVKKDSGVRFLDEAAIAAFQAAQPFPNPPRELQDPDGLIRFQFGFFLEINGRGFRMFRAP